MRLSLNFLVSSPDFRLLVRSSVDAHHETTLVVPDLLVATVPYARLLVEEGNQFREHAVALVESDSADPTGVIERALSAARPTRISFARWSAEAEIVGFSGEKFYPSQVAASAVAIHERVFGLTAQTSLVPKCPILTFTRGAFLGEARLTQVAKMFEVELEEDVSSLTKLRSEERKI